MFDFDFHISCFYFMEEFVEAHTRFSSISHWLW